MLTSEKDYKTMINLDLKVPPYPPPNPPVHNIWYFPLSAPQIFSIFFLGKGMGPQYVVGVCGKMRGKHFRVPQDVVFVGKKVGGL